MKIFVWILFVLIVAGLSALLVFEVVSLVKAIRNRKKVNDDKQNTSKRKEK